MQHLCQHTTHTPRSDRAEHWADINRQHFGNLSVDQMDLGFLDAQLSRFELTTMRLFLIDAPAHRVRRGNRHDRDALDDAYKLVMQLRGRGHIEQCGRAYDLYPGDWSLYDPREPYSIQNLEAAKLLVLQIPRERLSGFKWKDLHTSDPSSRSKQGMSAVFGGFLMTLSDQLADLPDSACATIEDTLVGLLAPTLANAWSEPGDEGTPTRLFNMRVKHYIQMHLSDPDLSIERIAHAMRCSKRYLHIAFENEAQTLVRFLWVARLERCHATLTSPQSTKKSVAQIAYAWGFRSSAHFCRLFKSHYGITPSEVRQSQDHSF